jgi:haloalkane dehalogenase
VNDGAERPPWVDQRLYPFAPHFETVSEGRLHLVDEGEGPAVVMVHGAPAWSFLYRDLVLRLRGRHRCIAPDLMGFGFSDKPEGFSYHPREHARHLALLLEAREVRDATLVVHDWGGPIGLAWAISHPDRVRRLVVLNTWLWSTRGTLRGELTGRLFASAPWRVLERRLSLSTRFFLPGVFGDRSRLSKDVHRHYREPFAQATWRRPNEVLWREILGASEWLESLWQRRAALGTKPALIVWGLRDRAFTPRDLARWEEALPDGEVVRLTDVGHFVPEEAPERLGEAVEAFLQQPAP